MFAAVDHAPARELGHGVDGGPSRRSAAGGGRQAGVHHQSGVERILAVLATAELHIFKAVPLAHSVWPLLDGRFSFDMFR